MVTAEIANVYSAWFSTFEKRGEGNGSQAFYWNRSAPGLLHGVCPVGKRKRVSEEMEAGRHAEVRRQVAAHRRSGGGDDREHPVVPRSSGAAGRPRRGGEPNAVEGDQAFGAADRTERCPAAGAVPGQGFTAGGADER